jgi:hypothetical protein
MTAARKMPTPKRRGFVEAQIRRAFRKVSLNQPPDNTFTSTRTAQSREVWNPSELAQMFREGEAAVDSIEAQASACRLIKTT